MRSSSTTGSRRCMTKRRPRGWRWTRRPWGLRPPRRASRRPGPWKAILRSRRPSAARSWKSGSTWARWRFLASPSSGSRTTPVRPHRPCLRPEYRLRCQPSRRGRIHREPRGEIMKRLLTLLLALLPITDAQARAQVILPTGETTQISRIWDGTRIVGVNADGSVNVSQAGVWTASQDPAAVGLSVSGTITATCADPCNSPETANSTVKRTLGWMHGVAIYVVTSTWTGTIKVEGTADNTHWLPLTTLNGGGFTPAFNRNTVFTTPTSDTYFVPNTTPGMLSVRIRGVTGSGSMDVVINVNNADAYNVLLPVSSWVFGTAKIPQRGVLTGGSDNTTNCDGTGCMIPNIVNNVAPVTTSVGQYVRQVPADTTSGAVTLSSNCADPCTGSNQSGTIEIKIAGQDAVFAHLSAALSTGQTIKFEQSIDDNDWSTVQYFAWSGGARGTTATNPWTVPSDWSIMFREGARFARIRCVSGCDD